MLQRNMAANLIEAQNQVGLAQASLIDHQIKAQKQVELAQADLTEKQAGKFFLDTLYDKTASYWKVLSQRELYLKSHKAKCTLDLYYMVEGSLNLDHSKYFNRREKTINSYFLQNLQNEVDRQIRNLKRECCSQIVTGILMHICCSLLAGLIFGAGGGGYSGYHNYDKDKDLHELEKIKVQIKKIHVLDKHIADTRKEMLTIENKVEVKSDKAEKHHALLAEMALQM